MVGGLFISVIVTYKVAQTITEDYGKCVDNHTCNMGILYVANSIQYTFEHLPKRSLLFRY